MVEWFKAPVLKTGVGASPPWVRIPLPPPFLAHAPVGAPHGRHSCRVALLPSTAGCERRSNLVPGDPPFLAHAPVGAPHGGTRAVALLPSPAGWVESSNLIPSGPPHNALKKTIFY
jgi:hypothetical protein